MIRSLASLGAAAVVCLAAGAAFAQLPGQTPRDPQQLQLPQRAPLLITPSITVTEEFNDNILLDNRDKRWDFITGFTPGIAVMLERPTYRVAGSYSFTAELFARDTDRSHAFDRQDLALDALYRVDPRLTLTLANTLSVSTDTNLVGTEGVSTGRDDGALSNSIAPGLSYQIDPLTGVRAFGSYTLLRYDRADLQESDVFRFETVLDRRLTPRLSGTVGYDFGYFDIEAEPETTTHTPRLGVIYRFTETITGSITGGPVFERRRGDTRVTPAVAAAYRQRMAFGAIGLTYDRYVGTAGGLGGTTDNQAIAATVDVLTLRRGLTLSFSPRYSTSESADDRIDIRGFTLPLQATYRFTPWLAVVGAYQFFSQRSDGTGVTRTGRAVATDADQNRLFVGLQFGYPIRVD